jgi:hypothetical protein
MATVSKVDFEKFVGRPLDRLTLAEREALVGKFIAVEVYSPKNLALRRIAAMGEDVRECVAGLRRRGLDPFNYEFTPLNPPY